MSRYQYFKHFYCIFFVLTNLEVSYVTSEYDCYCNSDPELLFLRYLVWSLVFCLPMTPTPSSCKSRAAGSTQQLPLVGAIDNYFYDTLKTLSAWQQSALFHMYNKFFFSSLQMTEFKHSKTRAPHSRSQRENQEGEFVPMLMKERMREDDGQ